jgi:hypothetical protein
MPYRLGIPVSIPARNRNCPVDAGGALAETAATMYSVDARVSSSRFGSRFVGVAGWTLIVALLALEWLAGHVSVHAAVVAAPHITLVVFADKPMPDDQWALLATTLQLRFENLAVETHFASSGFEVMRGDKLAAGTQFDQVIPIYLHGECHLYTQPGPYTVHGALGWVLRDHGAIKPFIHIDCARIAEMLGQRVFGLETGARNSIMAEAVARVALHEWLHIATQNSTHARDGIFKGAFSITDLIPEEARGRGQLSRGK